jgi:hypothetical protein
MEPGRFPAALGIIPSTASFLLPVPHRFEHPASPGTIETIFHSWPSVAELCDSSGKKMDFPGSPVARASPSLFCLTAAGHFPNIVKLDLTFKFE